MTFGFAFAASSDRVAGRERVFALLLCVPSQPVCGAVGEGVTNSPWRCAA